MKSLTSNRRPAVIAALALAGLAVVLSPVVAASVLAAPASRTLLAAAPARGADGRLLSLSAVTIPAGATIAKHRHPGTQVATIISGALRYEVLTGAVEIYRTGPEGTPILHRRIAPGTTGTLRAGDTLVEQPGDIHEARNRGTVAVQISLGSLFPKGAPAAIPVTG